VVVFLDRILLYYVGGVLGVLEGGRVEILGHLCREVCDLLGSQTEQRLTVPPLLLRNSAGLAPRLSIEDLLHLFILQWQLVLLLGRTPLFLLYRLQVRLLQALVVRELNPRQVQLLKVLIELADLHLRVYLPFVLGGLLLRVGDVELEVLEVQGVILPKQVVQLAPRGQWGAISEADFLVAGQIFLVLLGQVGQTGVPLPIQSLGVRDQLGPTHLDLLVTIAFLDLIGTDFWNGILLPGVGPFCLESYVIVNLVFVVHQADSRRHSALALPHLRQVF